MINLLLKNGLMTQQHYSRTSDYMYKQQKSVVVQWRITRMANLSSSQKISIEEPPKHAQ